MNIDLPIIGWARVAPEFGSALPHGSCNAIVDLGGLNICGFPRRVDGSCIGGHPAQPPDADLEFLEVLVLRRQLEELS